MQKLIKKLTHGLVRRGHTFRDVTDGGDTKLRVFTGEYTEVYILDLKTGVLRCIDAAHPGSKQLIVRAKTDFYSELLLTDAQYDKATA